VVALHKDTITFQVDDIFDHVIPRTVMVGETAPTVYQPRVNIIGYVVALTAVFSVRVVALAIVDVISPAVIALLGPVAPVIPVTPVNPVGPWKP
jgi:hypothetical protein